MKKQELPFPRPPFPDVPDWAWKVVEACFQREPHKRKSAEELLNDLNKVKACDISDGNTINNSICCSSNFGVGEMLSNISNTSINPQASSVYNYNHPVNRIIQQNVTYSGYSNFNFVPLSSAFAPLSLVIVFQQQIFLYYYPVIQPPPINTIFLEVETTQKKISHVPIK
jgi:serine/threonine protein kinase